jgi:hypothetical protein
MITRRSGGVEEESLELTVRYKGLEKKVVGNPAEVSREFFAFLAREFPSLTILTRVSIGTDLISLLEDCEGVIALAPEGVVLLATDLSSLTDKELVLLHLLKAKIANLTGKSEKDSLKSSDLMTLTGKSAGTLAGRISELCSEGLAERAGKAEYRITTLGTHRFRREVLPKIKSHEVATA